MGGETPEGRALMRPFILNFYEMWKVWSGGGGLAGGGGSDSWGSGRACAGRAQEAEVIEREGEGDGAEQVQQAA